MRVMMIVSSGGSYFLNAAVTKARYKNAKKMNFEGPLTSLVWLTSIVSIILTFVVSYLLIGGSTDGRPGARLTTGGCSLSSSAWAPWPALSSPNWSRSSPPPSRSTSKRWSPRPRRVGPSLDILSGFVSGNFSAYYIGFAIMVLMGVGYVVSTQGLGRHHARSGRVRLRPGGLRLPGHGPGDHRRGLLRPGDRQRSIGLRTVDHRADPERRRRDREGLRLQTRLRRGQGQPRGERRGGQHLQGDCQAGAHRHGRGRRHHDDLLHHHEPHRWTDR